MKKYIKIAMMIFFIAVIVSVVRISKNYTWENDFYTKLLCEIIEIVFVIFPLVKYYSDLLEINKQD